jgi:hypothetical protein
MMAKKYGKAGMSAGKKAKKKTAGSGKKKRK